MAPSLRDAMLQQAHAASPHRAHAHAIMIDLGTLAGLLERQHELHAYCRRCDRWRTLDLPQLVAAGLGARRLPLRVRCHVCGEEGQLQIRPPMPSRTSSGWIAPPVLVPGGTVATNRGAGAPRDL